MSKIFKILFIILLACVMAFSYYIVNKDEAKKTESKDKEKVKLENTIQNDIRLSIAELDTMNPYRSENRNVHEIIRLFYDSLYTYDGKYNLRHELAEKIEKIDDKTYKIILKKVQHTDGSLLKAEDIEFSIQEIVNGKNPYKENVKNIESTQIESENTLIVKLRNPDNFFEYNMVFPILKKTDLNIFRDNNQTPYPIGVGKYVVKELKNNVLRYELSSNYWNENFKPQIREVYVNIYQTMGEVYTAFKAGNIDIVTTKENQETQIIGQEGHTKASIRGTEFYFVALNNQKIAKNERREIYKTIKESNIELKDVGLIESDNVLDYGTDKYFNIDKEKKKEEENNLGVDFKKRKQIIVNSENAIQKRLAEIVANKLSEKGIKVNIKEEKSKRYYEIIENKEYEIAIAGIRTGYSPNISRILGINNVLDEEIWQKQREIEEIEDKGKVEKEEEIKNKMKELEKKVYEESIYVPLVRNSKKIYIKSGLVVPENLEGITSYNIYTDIVKWYRR